MRLLIAGTVVWLAYAGIAHADEVDLARPLGVQHGTVICQTAEGLSAVMPMIMAGSGIGPTVNPADYGCMTIGKDYPVTLVDKEDGLTVRITITTPDKSDSHDFYTLSWMLRNTMPAAPKASQVGFSENDLPAIVDASQHNELRFDRDYKNHPFDATMPFKSASDHAFGMSGFAVLLQSSSGEVHCDFGDANMRNKVADWSPRQPIRVHGIIADTTLGSLDLHDCTMQ